MRLLSDYGRGEAEGTSLALAALWIGALDRPTLRLAKYTRHLDALADKVRAYARDADNHVDAALMTESLFQVLARHHGYGGPEQGALDEDCFEFSRVIDHRTGASEPLAILYAEVARRVGWEADILRIPGRLLVRLERDGERQILDPAGAGQALSPADIRALAKAFGGNEVEVPPGSLVPLSDHEVLLRMMTGRKAVLLRERRLEDAATLVEHALLLAPDDPTLWRESGLLYARLDRVQASIEALEEYLRIGDDDQGRYRTTMLLQELRERLT